MQGSTDPFFTAAYLGAKAEAAKLDPGHIDVYLTGPGSLNDVESTTDLNALVAKHVSGIVFTPVSATADMKPVEAAMKAGVPVAIYNASLANNSVSVGIAYSNNYGLGYIAGERMCSAVGAKTHGDVAIMEAIVGIPFITARWTGFKASLKKYCPGVTVVASEDVEDSAATAETVAESLLIRYPSMLGLFCDNDVDASGAAKGVELVHGFPHLKLIAIDAEPVEVQLLREGYAEALVAQNPRLMGADDVEMIWDYIHHDTKYNHDVDTGDILMTKANLSTTIKYEY